MNFREDYARNRTDHSAENMTILHHMALNLLVEGELLKDKPPRLDAFALQIAINIWTTDTIEIP